MMHQPSEFLTAEVVAESHWLRLERLQYRTSTGEVRDWDRCVRTPPENRAEMQQRGQKYRRGSLLDTAEKSTETVECQPSFKRSDAASIVALTYHSKTAGSARIVAREDAGILLVRQFRPPVGNASIEFPAGLLDPGETAAQAALRELQEETGFVASKIVHESPNLLLSPGVTNESTVIVIVTVDLDAPENLKPRQQLDEAEEIDVLHVHLKDLDKTLREESKKGNSIFDEVYAVTVALKILPDIQV